MAKMLFFLEAFLFAALGLTGIILAPDLRPAFFVPFALSLVVPLACALAVWRPGELIKAFRLAFSPPVPAQEARESVHVLDALNAFCTLAAIAGLAISLAAALPRLLKFGTTQAWYLLGGYLALYSLLNAVVSKSMAKVVARLYGTPAGRTRLSEPELASAFASKHGLTPRESEVASLIAGGASYKETASRLSISIKTVKTHIAHVYEKTGCGSNVGLVLLQKAEAAESHAGAGAEAPHTKS